MSQTESDEDRGEPEVYPHREDIVPVDGVTCTPYGNEFYPLHEEWADGVIGEEDTEYRILRGVGSGVIIVEFPETNEVVQYELTDLLTYAFEYVQKYDAFRGERFETEAGE